MGEVTCGGSPHLSCKHNHEQAGYPTYEGHHTQLGSPTSMYTGLKTHFETEALGNSEMAYTGQTTNVYL